MQKKSIQQLLLFVLLSVCCATACKKEENYPPMPDAVYLVSNAITGPGNTASTAITNSASGKVSVSPAVARIFVNTVKAKDVTITYELSGTAQEGVNYTKPDPMSITIPAGKWFADIKIPVINAPLPGNRTIIVTLKTATDNVQLGLGPDRNYKTFTYTLTN